MMDLFLNELLSYIIIIPAALLCILPMRNQMKYPKGSVFLRFFPAYALLSMIGSWITVRFAIDGNIMFFAVIMICFVIYVMCINAHISKALAAFMNMCALYAIISNSAACFDAARHPRLGINSSTSDYILFQLAAGVILTAVLAIFFYKYGSTLMDELDLPKVWCMTVPFSMCILLINVFIRPLKYETLHVNRIGWVAAFSLTAMFFAWVLSNITFYLIAKGILDAAKAEQRLKILEMQEIQYQTVQKYMDETARARHDFRQTVRTLYNMAKSGDADEIRGYLKAYMESFPENEIRDFCENRAVNAILNYYAESARASETVFDFAVTLSENLNISDVDLCSIIGNLMENAVNACKKSDAKEHFIQLTVTGRGGWLYIVSTNSFDGHVDMRNGAYFSVGRNHTGLGLSSIATIVSSYGGTVEFSNEGKEFLANIAIPLY